MSEKVKRLTPVSNILRQLYLKSGNLCAYPGCNNLLLNYDGEFIGDICHIEAAEEGGQRFNPNMTNEERRSFSNLILLCREHHKVTDDVNRFPKERMYEMKLKHEEKYGNFLEKIKNSIKDYGIYENFSEAKNCLKMSDVLGWGVTEIECLQSVEDLNKLLTKIKNLPPETKKLLSIMVSRSFDKSQYGLVVPLHEIEKVTFLDDRIISENIDILERSGITREIEYDEEDGCYHARLRTSDDGWQYWEDIKLFCEKEKIGLDEITVNLNFGIFDK
jgi:hypothetical protein